MLFENQMGMQIPCIRKCRLSQNVFFAPKHRLRYHVVTSRYYHSSTARVLPLLENIPFETCNGKNASNKRPNKKAYLSGMLFRVIQVFCLTFRKKKLAHVLFRCISCPKWAILLVFYYWWKKRGLHPRRGRSK